MGIRYNIYQDEIKDYFLCPHVHFSMELPRIFWKHYVIIMVSKINNSCEGQVILLSLWLVLFMKLVSWNVLMKPLMMAQISLMKSWRSLQNNWVVKKN